MGPPHGRTGGRFVAQYRGRRRNSKAMPAIARQRTFRWAVRLTDQQILAMRMSRKAVVDVLRDTVMGLARLVGRIHMDDDQRQVGQTVQ
jgi:hypothetical protein